MKNTANLCYEFSCPEDKCATVASVLARNYISIAEVDLITGNVFVIKSSEAPKYEGRELPWCDLLDWYAHHRAHPEDRIDVLSLTNQFLNSLLAQGRESSTLEVRCISKKDVYVWVEIEISIIHSKEKRLLVTTRNIDENRMLKSIVDKYVYEEMDYFVLLDAKNNSYTMFSGEKSGTPLPPATGDDYTSAVREYNMQYVIPEEREWVTASMQIPHVIDMLEKANSYSFTGRFITDDGEHRCTRVQFMYYDKSARLILVTRTDITQIFLEEQEQSQRLAAALREAQHDALTGILNQRGMEPLVRDSLAHQHGKKAACMFIDVDNFKMVNDTLGHSEGDKLLQFLAESIQKLAKNTGIAGRIGGDEFILFLPTISSMEQIVNCADQICSVFDDVVKGLNRHLPVSCSVGISMFPKDGTDYETLIRKADQALYNSKRYGKSRFYFYSEEDSSGNNNFN